MKTVDDILLEAIEEEVKQEMEKEASTEAPSSAPIESSKTYEEFQKIAQSLRDLVKETPEQNTVQDFMQTVKSVEK